MRYVSYTIKQIAEISEEDFVKALFEHTENRTMNEVSLVDQEKINSWKDCLFFLQKYIKQYNENNIDCFRVCFEYQIFDGTWIDAIIVCQDKLIILEFKSGKDDRVEILDGHRSQIAGYFNKITRCNRVIWEEVKRNSAFTVEKYLVYTNPAMLGKTGDFDYILVCDDFKRVIESITVPADEQRVSQLLEFVEELDITTTGVMKNILHRKVLSEMYVQDNNVTACAEIVEQIQKQKGLNLNLIFIKGAPGTGKTGTAFSLLEKYIDGGAKYVTGNGNLSTIFQQMIKEEHISGTEAAAVGSLHDLYDVSAFCRKHMGQQPKLVLQSVDNKILIIDEAQRVWNPTQVALAKKNKLNHEQQAFVIHNEISEAMLVLRAVLQATYKDETSRTVVFLMGSGQEIYIGEESGEEYIKKAIQHIKGLELKKDIKINLYVPTLEMYNQYKSLADECEIRDGLVLEENKRNTYNIEFVNSIIDEADEKVIDVKDAFYIYKDIEMMMNAINPITTGAYTVGIVANGFDTKTDWVRGIYGKNKPVSYLSLNGQKKCNIDNKDLKSFYINRTCNTLTTFVSQFNCQGLELDYPVMIWGNQLLRRNDQWVVSSREIGAINSYSDNLETLIKLHPELHQFRIDKDELKEKFVRNCYRVLMTRARIATYIYVEDDETYQYLKKLILN